MDVPFVSSGAMSRAHYALVRKVETAASPYAADMVLLAEVEAIQSRLLHSTLNLKQVKESLIILLYCSMAVNPGVDLDVLFALPHAISLAEAGKTIQDKRIGYLYCAELMPRHHELQLMLVNTFRKDIESRTVSKICLALDTLLHFPPDDVVPAIQDRLYDLLSHNSPHVRRRALLVYRVLSKQDTDILRHVVDKTRKRLEDTDSTVVCAALSLGLDIIAAKLLPTNTFHTVLTSILQRMIQARSIRDNFFLLRKVLESMRDVRPSEEDLQLLLRLVPSRRLKGPLATVLRYQCFLAAGPVSDALLSNDPSSGGTLIRPIRGLLTSEEPNEVYAFLCCLGCLDPSLWAGGTPNVPSVLQAWEVERIMCQLDSTDSTIRRKTLHILLGVDRNIVEAYYTKLASGNFASLPMDTQGDALTRPLEIIELLCGEDGEDYAKYVIQMLSAVEGENSRGSQVIEGAVEDILTHTRGGNTTFRSGFIGALFAVLDEREKQLGPTLTTIYSALVCEYLDISPVSPERLLRGLARLLPLESAAVQDACLLSMLRVAANCDTPHEVTQVVRKVQETGGRHIRRRCQQFLTLSNDPLTLRNILSHTKSSSLPDFLVALEAYSAEQTIHLPSSTPTSPERSSSRLSQSSTKLRYAAYDPPKVTSKLRRSSTSSSRSNSTIGIRRRDSEESLSRTFTPGELAIAAGRQQLKELTKSPKFSTPILPSVQIMDEDDLASRVDLIAFDSPFLTDPPVTPSIMSSIIEPDFENTWEALVQGKSRGWSESAIEEIVRKLQGLQHRMSVKPADQAPFQGELKILIYDSADKSVDQPSAALRLKESDDDSCLWHLRSNNEGLQASIKAIMKDS